MRRIMLARSGMCSETVALGWVVIWMKPISGSSVTKWSMGLCHDFMRQFSSLEGENVYVVVERHFHGRRYSDNPSPLSYVVWVTAIVGL